MRRVAVPVLLVCAAISGCAEPKLAAVTETEIPTVAYEGELRTQVEAAVGSLLGAPGSARYESVAAMRAPTGPVLVCGYVSQPDPAGTLAVARLFVTQVDTDGTVSMASIADSEAATRQHLQMCRDSGIQI